MGSHGASIAEGCVQMHAHLGVSEEERGGPMRAPMKTVSQRDSGRGRTSPALLANQHVFGYNCEEGKEVT
jgi:hypothetical protein